MNTVQPRPFASPLIYDDNSISQSSQHIINFRHPGYPESFNQNKLFALFAWDSPTGGLHAGTALLACRLIACNRWDGYLTIERDGQKLDLHDDDMLTAQDYYFHVPESGTVSTSEGGSHTYKYPIFPTFQHWTFPHRHIPLDWRSSRNEHHLPSRAPAISSVSAAVIARDQGCAISTYQDNIERAHFCPRSELQWFKRNGMHSYNEDQAISGDAVTDDISNAFALRSDIHHAFDECKFALVRKAGYWVTHFFGTTYDLGKMYHNRCLELSTGIAPEFILTRFAWTVFPYVKCFMETGLPRLVKVREEIEGEFHEIVKTLDSAGFAQISGTNRGRSTSPRKRKASESLVSIVEAERCYNSDHHDLDYEMPDVLHEYVNYNNEQDASNFSSDNKTSSQFLPNTAIENIRPYKPLEDWELEGQRLSALRMCELRKRRPSDPTLFCCDYRRAEKANALGIPGKREYGGGHLCMECLGVEYFPSLDEEESTEDAIDTAVLS